MRTLLFTLFLSISFIANSQDKKFPDDFLGSYYGKLQITGKTGKYQIDMEFHFIKTDTIGTYKYTLVYNKVPRNYFLIEKDKTNGIYEIDEKNGIILQAKVVDNSIYSIFEVNNNLITTTEHFYDDHMEFEIMFSNTSKTEKTGEGTKEIPEVTIYPIGGIQRAILIKKEE